MTLLSPAAQVPVNIYAGATTILLNRSVAPRQRWCRPLSAAGSAAVATCWSRHAASAATAAVNLGRRCAQSKLMFVWGSKIHAATAT